MAQTRDDAAPGTEAARMLRAIVEAVPATTRLEKAVAREARAVAVALDTIGNCLDWSTSETRA